MMKNLTVEQILNIAISDAHAHVTGRQVGQGRKGAKWDAGDYDLCLRTFCRNVSKLPAPYPEMAATMLREHEESAKPPG